MTQGSPGIDAALVKRAKRGDGEAQETIYRVFAPAVYTLARRILVAAAPAEDVLQETFVEVLRKLGDLKNDAELGAWIKRIALNKSLAYLRSPWTARRVTGLELSGLEQASAASEPEPALARALDALSPTARAVVWLHDVEGYTHKEIGSLMGRSPSFSKSQLARAHERLRHSLEDSAEQAEMPICGPALKTS